MCNIPSPNPRPLIIEVFDTGKVSLAPFVCSGENQFTIDELKKCRDYIDLIIANPDNFHVVKPNLLQGKVKITYCDTCGQRGKKQDATSSMCHDCERKQIINSANVALSEDGLCMAVNCFNPRPAMRAFCEDHQSCYVGPIKGDAQTYEDKAAEVTAPFVDAMNSVDVEVIKSGTLPGLETCNYCGCDISRKAPGQSIKRWNKTTCLKCHREGADKA